MLECGSLLHRALLWPFTATGSHSLRKHWRAWLLLLLSSKEHSAAAQGAIRWLLSGRLCCSTSLQSTVAFTALRRLVQ